MTHELVGAAAAPASDRLRQLDGLRGIAAVIVVVHHSLLLYPRFADTYQPSVPMPAVGTLLWWLTATPLKALTAGGEAVLVFFVMSGIVLALPVLAKVNFDWVAYYPRRLVRLYLPVVAAVLFAALVIMFVPQGAAPGFSWWVNAHAVDLTVARVVSATDVLFGDVIVDNPLWSLRWEVLYSLALPAFIAAAILARKRPVLGILVACILAGVGASWLNPSFTYLPAFFIGAVIAVALGSMRTGAERLSAVRGSTALWVAIGTVALVALLAYWLVRPWADANSFGYGLTIGLRTLGAAALVLVAAFWAPAVRVLTSRFVQWLGRISFSLYLVHVPIALAAIHLLGAGSWKWATVATVSVSVVVAALFTTFVEKPSHRLSKRAGAAASRRFGTVQREIEQDREAREERRS